MNDLWQAMLSIRSDVFWGVGLVLAALTTVHILWHKFEVPSAIGWIGLVWFAPFTGTALYFMLGVNRVERRARQHRPARHRQGRGRDPDPDPAGGDRHLQLLQRGVGRITRRPILAGNAAEILDSGDAAYPPMVAAIGAAQSSVGLSSYIFRDDHWGGQFIDALVAAKDRGVEVRVIIDGIGGGWLRMPAYRRLRRNGVKAALFFHSLLPWRMPFLNLRSHKKILVVDGRLGFTGGLNIADENVMATHPPAPVVDTHFRLDGPVVAQLVAGFAQDWAFVTGEVLDGDAWFPDLPEADGALARVIDAGPDEEIEKIEFAILEAISCAQESISVITPYFLPDERLVSALALASIRGVSVDVLIPQRSDHRLVDWAMRANSGPLLTHGVRIWRCPPPFRHSKALVVDQEWCLIGSSNWDIRSFRLNFELCVEIYDRDLAAKLTAQMQAWRGPRLTREELRRRPFLRKLADAAVRLGLPYL